MALIAFIHKFISISELQLKAATGFHNDKHHINLSLIEFEEDNVKIVYCPALDLSGYGHNSTDAKNSFFEAYQ